MVSLATATAAVCNDGQWWDDDGARRAIYICSDISRLIKPRKSATAARNDDAADDG